MERNKILFGGRMSGKTNSMEAIKNKLKPWGSGKTAAFKFIIKRIIEKDRLNKIKLFFGIKIKCSICGEEIKSKICPSCKHDIYKSPGIVTNRKIKINKPVVYSEEVKYGK